MTEPGILFFKEHAKNPVVEEYEDAVVAFEIASNGDADVPWQIVDRLNNAICGLLADVPANDVPADLVRARRQCLASPYVREQFLESGNPTTNALMKFLLKSFLQPRS